MCTIVITLEIGNILFKLLINYISKLLLLSALENKYEIDYS